MDNTETQAHSNGHPGGGRVGVVAPHMSHIGVRPPQRVAFLRRFGLKTGIVSRKLRACTNVFIVSISNE